MESTKFCNKCQLPKNISEFYVSKNTKDGYRCYCKICEKLTNASREPQYSITRKRYRQSEKYKQIKKDYYQDKKELILSLNSKWQHSVKGKYNSYIRGAIKRNIVWNLSFEEFKSFWNLSCFYCDEEIKTIGIDRKNNNIGYELQNCVPCCKHCNRMKREMSMEEFFEKIKKIFKFKSL